MVLLKALLLGLVPLFLAASFHKFGRRKRSVVGKVVGALSYARPVPGDEQTSDLFVVRGRTPQQNTQKAIEMMGGIESFVETRDIVILKPNCQWWNQGRTNLAAMKGFIDLVLAIPGFEGEVIIAENHHFMDDTAGQAEPDNIRGWTHLSEINGQIDGVNHDVNTLIESYHAQGHANVSKVHWRDGGPKVPDAWGNGQNGGLVQSPAQGDGYVWSEIDYTFSPLRIATWKVRMSYPIFTSPYSGITIDFRNGAFRRDGAGDGHYLEEPRIKFINFAVMNDHGYDTGITGAVKNYMGVMDMSCGDFGVGPEGYNNVHTCGGRYFRYGMAGAIGHFMKTIRRADLNIVTAEWVGWGHRTDTTKAVRSNTILAGTDPIALDYYGAKHLILPQSRNRWHHDPDHPLSSIGSFLRLAARSCGSGMLKEAQMRIQACDLESAD